MPKRSGSNSTQVTAVSLDSAIVIDPESAPPLAVTTGTAGQSKKSTSRSPIKESQVKLVFGYSAGWCAFPGCHVRNLVEAQSGDPSVVIGEIAHINSYDDNGPRADKALSISERNAYPNLVLFCPTHHTLVDKQPNAYAADDLKKWKSQLETQVTRALLKMMPQVSFAELQLITNGLLAKMGSRTTDFSVIPPESKMAKNQLSLKVRDYLVIALGRADVVAEFIDSFTRVDATFADRLRSGFVQRYQTLKDDGAAGDDLFNEMLTFASSGNRSLEYQAAGLALLGYFFEACEVFEK